MTAHFVHLLEDLRRRVGRMASLVEDIVQEATEAVLETNRMLAHRVIARDAEVDNEEVAIATGRLQLYRDRLALRRAVRSEPAR